MAKYSFKLHDLTEQEMNQAKRHLGRFQKYGVKMTFLKKVAYIHLDDDQKYVCIFNYMSRFKSSGKLQANEKSLEWLKSWYGKL